MCEARFAFFAAEQALDQVRFEHFDQAPPPVICFARAQLRGGFGVLAESLDARDERVNAAIFGGHCAHNFGMPAEAIGRQLEHRLQLLLNAVGAFAFGFIQHKNVADFHQAGLHVLHVVAQAGNEHHQRAVRQAHDIDLILADADRFDEDDVFACCVKQQRNIRGGARQAAEKSAGGHRANENSFVVRVALHANAVAQNRAAGEWAGGIDRDNADRFAFFAITCGEPIDQRALARAGRAGDADHIGAAGAEE